MLSKDSRTPPIPSEYLNKSDCIAPLIALLIFLSDAGRSDTNRRAFFRSNGLLSLSFTGTVTFEFESSCWELIDTIAASFRCWDCDTDDDAVNAGNGCDNGNDVICCCFGECNCAVVPPVDCCCTTLEDEDDDASFDRLLL